MTRYVDPRTGEPVTAYSELTQTEWAIFINDDWKVSRNLTINAGLRYENYGTFKDSDDTLRNIDVRSRRDVRTNGWRPRAWTSSTGSSRPTTTTSRRGSVSRGTRRATARMAVRGGYGLAFDRLMNLPAENYRHSPPLRASVVLGQFFGTQFTYSLGDPSKPYLGYPVDPALQVGLDPRNGVIGARVNLTTVDPDADEPVPCTTGSSASSASSGAASWPTPTTWARPGGTCTTPTTSTASAATCSTDGSTASTRASGRSPW